MSDLSVRKKNAGVRMIVDALMRVTGASSAVVLLPGTVSDQSDAGQLGISTPKYQLLTLAPVAFRRTRPTMQEGQAAKYELLVSASAVSLQVDALQIGSAFNLFQAIAGMTIGGLNLTIESWACSLALGEPVLYRLLLRESNTLEITTES